MASMTGRSMAADASPDADLPAACSAMDRQGIEETAGALLLQAMGIDLGPDGGPRHPDVPTVLNALSWELSYPRGCREFHP